MNLYFEQGLILESKSYHNHVHITV